MKNRGPVDPGSHTNQPPNGPRTSNVSSSRATLTIHGETSPSATSTTVMSSVPGAEAIE